jgi:hypothetical protein
MIPARTTLGSLNLSFIPAEAEEELPETETEKEPIQWPQWIGSAWRYLASWIPSPHPDLEKIKFTPRSYNQEFAKLCLEKRDAAFIQAFLDKALRLLPLETLTESSYFWVDRHIEYVCQALKDKPEQYHALLQLTPKEFYIQYPAHCKTRKQVEMMLDVAFEDKAKLEDMTDAVLIAIGDERNTIELDEIYYYYLSLLIEKKGSDEYIAERLKSSWEKLEQTHILAIQKIENAPHIQKIIAENLP